MTQPILYYLLKFLIYKKRYLSLLYAGQKTTRSQWANAIARGMMRRTDEKTQATSNAPALGARGQKPATNIDPILFYTQVFDLLYNGLKLNPKLELFIIGLFHFLTQPEARRKHTAALRFPPLPSSSCLAQWRPPALSPTYIKKKEIGKNQFKRKKRPENLAITAKKANFAPRQTSRQRLH